MIKRRAPGAGKEFEVPFMLPHAPIVSLEDPIRILQAYFHPWSDEARRMGVAIDEHDGKMFFTFGNWSKEVPDWAYRKVWKNKRSARLRQASGDYLVSIKDRETADEWEHSIPEESFWKLWSLASLELKKVRYHVPYKLGGQIEVDCWDWGVWRAEYEDTKEHVDNFELPDWAQGGVIVKGHPIFGSTRAMIELGQKELGRELEKLFRKASREG